MNIIETNIPDIDENNLDASKVNLSNKIIENVYPLLDVMVVEKKKELKTLRAELKEKKSKVTGEKTDLEGMLNEYKRKQKIHKLVDRIEKLVTSGLVYEGNMRHETVVLLKIVNDLSEEKLDQQIRNTMNTITKRFS